MDYVYYNNSLKDWGISILIIIGAILINNLIFYLIKRRTKKNTKSFIEYFLIALEKPILLGVTLLSIWLSANRLCLNDNIIDVIRKSYDAFVVLNITWFLSRFSSALIKKYLTNEKRKRLKINPKLGPVISRLVLTFLWLVGIATALTNIGINTATLISTLGIGGIALALAAQDTIKNILGGITLFTDTPFRIGDLVRIDSHEGRILDIGLRSTRILNSDQRIITIPNFKVMDAFIINISHEHGRRIILTLRLTYDTSPEKMEEAITILKNLPKSVSEIKEKDLIVSFSSFEESHMELTFIYFVKKDINHRDGMSKVNMEILKSFNESGIKFAFPSRTVNIVTKNE
jgi:MscS family membrane protein